ncbi:bifunctional oligoribonuclease/PAP phosphatase NrnA [bacterium]|nr:bifunctional oligoribonuclease/PAP phosphatase NrnA [bacterium]
MMIRSRRTAINALGRFKREEEDFISEVDRARLIEEIGGYWSCAHSFWVFTHEHPDGDALGCNLATYAVLKALGKDVKVFSYDPIPRMYRFLPHVGSIVHTHTLPSRLPDVIQVNDNAAFERLGAEFAEQLTERGIGPQATKRDAVCKVLNLDHHIGNDSYGDINLIDPSCGACGELLFHAFSQLKLPITHDVAVNLYAAIMTDTGRFSYSNTDADTFYITTDLIRAGADPFDVANRVYNTRTIGQMRLFAKVMETIAIEPSLGYFFCTCTQEMLNETQTLMSDTEGITDLMKTVSDYPISFFFKEEGPNNYKVSARSNGSFDVRKLARRFGGGGHPAASGFRLHMPHAEACRALAAEMRRYRDELAAQQEIIEEWE